MIWIVVVGFVGFAVVMWARASKRRFEAEQAERRERQKAANLDAQEASLLARLKSDKDKAG